MSGFPLVCSGWYSKSAPRDYRTYGDEVIRSPKFRELWRHSLYEFADPDSVLVIDSHSPVKAEDLRQHSVSYQSVELLRNPGHSQALEGHYCGYMSSVLMGLEFALHSGVDYMVYIEQDALLFGPDIVRQVEAEILHADFVFGRPERRGHIQQSFFAVSKRGMRDFIRRLHRINYSDALVHPEVKFLLATSAIATSALPAFVSEKSPRRIRRLTSLAVAQALLASGNYRLLPFGYGRTRPINFTDRSFYFQHGSSEEIARYCKLVGFDLHLREGTDGPV